MAIQHLHSPFLKSQYPWTSCPLIVSAPLRLIATAPLAVAVSRSGGLGFIAAGTDLRNLPSELLSCVSSLQSPSIPRSPEGVLPIGVGFICWGADLSTATSVIESASLKPAAAWLFAPKDTKDLVSWTDGLRKASNYMTKIWIQVGTVKSAVEVARCCKPDVLVIQGADAGGHGLAHSGSIVSLVPECADALAREGFGHVPLIAAGGIADGRGVAAALTLGASGVALGTRFLASPEAVISKGYRSSVIDASDGGVSTARTTIYDRVRGTSGWPSSYNGRGILNRSYLDDLNGMEEEENKRLYAEAVKMGDEGWGENGRMTAYAGSGVGLIHKVIPAAEIVQELLKDSRNCLRLTSSRL